MDIILASASPRRKELLKNIFDEFRVIPADINENISQDISVDKRPEKIACKKALFIAKSRPDSLVIGCDTAVIIDRKMLGKPADKQDAVRMIKLLSGRTHKVITGCCLCLKGKTHSFSAQTLVEFYPITDDELNEYINTLENGNSKIKFEWQDKAGGYGIQGKAGLFVKGINGDYNNVVGLPCAELKHQIDSFIKE